MNASDNKIEMSKWRTLNAKRKLLVIIMSAATLIVSTSCGNKSSENAKLVAQCFSESLELGEIASQMSLGSSASSPDMSAFYINAANTLKNNAVSKSKELNLSPDKNEMAAYGNALKKSLVGAMASSANDFDAQRKYSDAFKNTSSICDRVMKL